MKKKGFEYEGKTIFFIDPQGKDASSDRWRATLYYTRNYARTAFFYSLADYTNFLCRHAEDTYAEYEDFPESWGAI